MPELDNVTPFPFECEACGTIAVLTPQRAFDAGWDYPNVGIGWWGVLSPRTCGSCPITETAWYAVTKGTLGAPLSARHQKTIERIANEQTPASRES